MGGEDVEHCSLSRRGDVPGELADSRQPINIDDNFWVSDADGQEVPFNEDLPAYGVASSEVSAGDNSFRIKVLYPDS